MLERQRQWRDAPTMPYGESAWHAMRHDLTEGASLHLWRIDIAHCAPEWESICTALSSAERERFERYVRHDDRMRSSITRGVLRQLLGFYLQQDPAALELDEGEGKKPRLRSSTGELEFNLSHSHEWAMIALAWGAAVGVDIEFARSEVDFDDIAPSVFTTREWAPIASLDRQYRMEAFFRGWVRKEAAIKTLGGGFQVPLHSVEVGCLPERENEGAIHVTWRGQAHRLYGIDLHAPMSYHAALACERLPGRLTEFQFAPTPSQEH